MHNQRLFTILFIAALGGFGAACQPTNSAGTSGGESARMGASQAAGAQIVVTNPMPHDMTVSADWGQGQKELGTVKPNETKTFDVNAPAGTQVKLTASDAAKTHSPEGTVTLAGDQAATWTIQ
ncbi:MAG: hypothetical protein AB1469_01005 [Pseudomonadota bacterium]